MTFPLRKIIWKIDRDRRVIVLRTQLRPFSSIRFSFQAPKKPPTYDRRSTQSSRVTFDLFSLPSASSLPAVVLIPRPRTNRCTDRPRNYMRRFISAMAAKRSLSEGRVREIAKSPVRFLAQRGRRATLFVSVTPLAISRWSMQTLRAGSISRVYRSSGFPRQTSQKCFQSITLALSLLDASTCNDVCHKLSGLLD